VHYTARAIRAHDSRINDPFQQPKYVPLPYLHRHENATHAAPKPDRGTGEEISRRSDSGLLSEITKAMIHTSRFSPVISLLVMVPVFVYSLSVRSYSDEKKL
jgi:hypothetical protein